MSNREFAEKDELFKGCCGTAGMPATKRQASKYRMGRGRAFKYKRDTIRIMKEMKDLDG